MRLKHSEWIAVLILLFSSTSHAISIGTCLSATSGSTTVGGYDLTSTSGNASFSTSASGPLGNCNSPATTINSNAANAGASVGVSASASAAGLSTSSGSAYTLSGTGSIGASGSASVIDEYNLGNGAPYGSSTAGSSLQQLFSLSAGETVDYSMTITLSGNVGVVGYATTFTPTFIANLTENGTSITTFGPSTVEYDTIPFTETYLGVLSNNSKTSALFALTATANSANYNVILHGPNHGGGGSGTLNYQYDMTIAPVPLPASAWMFLSGVAVFIIFHRRKTHVSMEYLTV